MLGMLPEYQTLFVVCCIFFATFVSATFGFGTALISMPLMALIIDIKTATPLAGMVGATVSILILLTHWRNVHFSSSWRLLIAAFFGIILGVYLLKSGSNYWLKFVLALVIILFSLYKLISPGKIELKSDRLSYLFGLIAGILGGAFHMNGPPVIIYGSLRHWTPSQFRATLQSFFLPAGLLALAGQYKTGLWTGEVLTLYTYCLPLVFLNVLIGNRLHKKIPEGRFDTYVYLLLTGIGTLLFIQTVSMV
jgi:uncharacterized membrane protein YfcA